MSYWGSTRASSSQEDLAEEIYSCINENAERGFDGAVDVSKPPRNEAVCWQPTAVDRSKRARINCISKCVAFSFCIHFVLILFSVGCGLSLYQINKKVDRKSFSFINESGERPHISHRLVLQMCTFAARRCGYRGSSGYRCSSGYQGYTCPSNFSGQTYRVNR